MSKELQVYVVGGAVRNVLMGVPVKDMDYVVVGSSPEEMLALGYTQVGADFPVFLHPITGDEFALARTERKNGKGYHGFDVDASPEVTLEEDLRRRDLTVNAMAIPIDKWDAFVQAANVPGSNQASWKYLVDPFLGRFDVAKAIARPCALETFVEDPLRLVRAARFSAIYGLVWSAEMNKAAEHIVKSGELHTLSKERFFAEIEKVLKDAPTAGAVREFSLRLLQFKLMPESFYWGYDSRVIIAKMAMMHFVADDHKSYGAKLNALCPSGMENMYANEFKFSGLLLDQIDLVHMVLEAANILAARDASTPIAHAQRVLMDIHENLRHGKTGITKDLLVDMVQDFEEVRLVLEWLPVVEQVFKDVCFATVKAKLPADTPKHMYSVEIQVARLTRLGELLDAK